MFETAKLRGRIVEKYGSQSAFAEAVHARNAFVTNYLRGKTVLNQDVIIAWAEALEIPDSEITLYFFTKKVHETEQKG